MDATSSEQKRQQRERALQLAWLCARALAEINEKLSDIRTLAQQTDLLRKLVEALPEQFRGKNPYLPDQDETEL